ncbi:MAG: hypothetical protein RL291_1171, partial [Pseudomonadota bacterium]
MFQNSVTIASYTFNVPIDTSFLSAGQFVTTTALVT